MKLRKIYINKAAVKINNQEIIITVIITIIEIEEITMVMDRGNLIENKMDNLIERF